MSNAKNILACAKMATSPPQDRPTHIYALNCIFLYSGKISYCTACRLYCVGCSPIGLSTIFVWIWYSIISIIFIANNNPNTLDCKCLRPYPRWPFGHGFCFFVLSIEIKVSHEFYLKLACKIDAYTLTAIQTLSNIHEKL